jgi:hypothetical protein
MRLLKEGMIALISSEFVNPSYQVEVIKDEEVY